MPKGKVSKQADIEGLKKRVPSLRSFDEEDWDVERIPTGIIKVDKILGGGLARQSFVEAFGPEGGGKSALGVQLMGQAQAFGEVVYVDLENTFNPQKALNSGVDLKRLLFDQPGTGEELFSNLHDMVSVPEISCVVVDSIAAIVTEAEINGDYGDAHVAQTARLMSASLKKLNNHMLERDSSIIILWINQLREKIGTMGFGTKTYTPGGRAVKFWCDTRLEVVRIESIKAGENTVGQKVKVNVIKSKASAPFQSANFDLYYDLDVGISNESAIFDEAVIAGLIKKSGAWYTDANGESLGQGREKALAKLRADTEYRESLVTALQQT